MWKARKGPRSIPHISAPLQGPGVPWGLGLVPVVTCSPLKPEINSFSTVLRALHPRKCLRP